MRTVQVLAVLDLGQACVAHLRAGTVEVSQRHPIQRREVGYLRAATVQRRQLHALERRQVGYRVSAHTLSVVSFIPFRGERSEIVVPSKHKCSSVFMPARAVRSSAFSGEDQSLQRHTLQRREVGHVMPSQFSTLSFMPSSGDRSVTRVP